MTTRTAAAPIVAVLRPLQVEAGRLLHATDVLLVAGGRDVRLDVRPGLVEFAALHVTGWSVVSLIPPGDAPAHVLGARSLGLVALRRRLAEMVRVVGRSAAVTVSLHEDHVRIGDVAVTAHAPGPAPPRPRPTDPPVGLVALDDHDDGARFLDPAGRVLRLDAAWAARLRHFGPARCHGFASDGRRYVQASGGSGGDLSTALVMPAVIVDEW